MLGLLLHRISLGVHASREGAFEGVQGGLVLTLRLRLSLLLALSSFLRRLLLSLSLGRPLVPSA